MIKSVDRENLKAVVILNKEEKEVSLTRFEYPYLVGYVVSNKIAVKTLYGNSLHRATLEITYMKNTKWENGELVNLGETDKQGISISWNGARGNGIGDRSKLAYIGWADNFKNEDFSKATRK